MACPTVCTAVVAAECDAWSQESSTREASPSPEQAQSRAKVTGWLMKRKSDVRSRIFRGTNRRHFTLDFEARIFFYSQSEGAKSASVPVGFSSISRVEEFATAELPEPAAEEPGAVPQEQPKEAVHPQQETSTRGFRVPKISRFGAAKKPTEHHGFVVCAGGKDMELICSSQSEANMWVTALREAMALGGSRRPSECEGEGPKAELDASAEREAAKADLSTSTGSTPRSPRSEEEDSLPEMLVPSAQPESMLEASTEGRVSPRGNAFGDEPVARSPSPVKETKRRAFGLLSRRRPRAEDKAAEDVTTLQDAGDQGWADEEEASPKTHALGDSEVSKRYGDKGQGLS
eukprot:CAMPEP_0197897690 /NCGR_PEP_ID=MMETSP1439-20131203/42321_1 /TAXON_ID=66791 /ORGANISM="Gonyaulax spinifera, Strain CCMP409" /LENGTH=345 /DNA_ID=CAMNT_0043518335 /DNA_START=64 /DNA_END=1097 /DNA_ORIENTATION=+